MSDFRTVTSIDPATPATGNYGHFSYPQPYDQIVGFHDLLVQLHKNDQIRDTRIPLPFSQIGIIRGLASEGVKAFPRQINVNGEMSKGAKLSKKEAMETFDIHYYRSQIFTPYIFDSYIDFSTSQGFVQERGAVTLEAFMVCSSYYRWLRQVHLSLFIKVPKAYLF